MPTGIYPRKYGPTEERFWSKVDTSGECWIWTACKNNSGYGQFSLKGRPQLAHRISWMFANGDIPPGLCVLHRCDTPACVRPDHLFLGNHADNMRDRNEKGRQSKGLERRLRGGSPKTATIQSRFRGVCWHKSGKKWQAEAKFKGKPIYLGRFTDEEAAHAAYEDFIAAIE